MATIPSITTWSNGQILTSAALNGNFGAIRDALVARGLFTDEARTITAVLTHSAQPVFSAGINVTGVGIIVATGGIAVNGGGINVTGNSVITGTLDGMTNVIASGTVTANVFSGSGASLTNLPAANLTGVLPAISGANLTSLNASNIASGTLNAARLPTIAFATAAGEAIEVVSGANVLAVDGAESAILVGTSSPSWQTTSAPVGSGASRYLNVTLNGTAYRIECKTVA